MKRRDWISLAGSLPLAAAELWPGIAHAAESRAVKPNWLGFGLNKQGESTERFPLTQGLLSGSAGSKSGSFQLTINEAIVQQLRLAGDIVSYKANNDFGENLLLAAVLDYENVLEAKLGTASFIVMHLVGHGVLLDFDRARGWSMRSSFPFPVTLLREGKSGNVEAEARQYMAEAYIDKTTSFASSFAKTALRLSPKWKDIGAGRGFNIRVMSSTMHADVQAKVQTWGIARNIAPNWLGHLASAALCEGLDVPVVPFAETRALGSYTYSFSDRLVAQNVRLPEENDIDLRLHVSLRNMGREIKYRAQLQRWEVTRMVVIDVRVLDDRNEELLNLRLGYQDDVPDALAREEDNSPARDAHFFDMAIYRGLQTLFLGIDRNDKNLLAKVFVKPDANQQAALSAFRGKYRRAFGKD